MIFLACIFLFSGGLFAQIKPLHPRVNSLVQKAEMPVAVLDSETNALLQKLEGEFRDGARNIAEEFVVASVSLSIPGIEPGIVSKNQARVILQDFFTQRATVDVSFSRRGLSQGNPFATGKLSMLSRGAKESFQIYVSLAKTDGSWFLAQLNIY